MPEYYVDHSQTLTNTGLSSNNGFLHKHSNPIPGIYYYAAKRMATVTISNRANISFIVKKALLSEIQADRVEHIHSSSRCKSQDFITSSSAEA